VVIYPTHHRARWYGPVLEALRQDYEGSNSTLPDLGRRHGTNRAVVVRLAREHGWQRHPDRRGRPGRIAGYRVEHRVGGSC
jgi:hypothetical protein